MRNEVDSTKSVTWLLEPEVTESLIRAASFAVEALLSTLVATLIWKYCLSRVWDWLTRTWHGNQS